MTRPGAPLPVIVALAGLFGAPATAAPDGPPPAAEDDHAEEGSPDAGDTVVVRGAARDPADPERSGASVTVVPVDERLPEGADVADAVARAPGTTVRRLGGLGAFSAVSLRGAALRQVEVLLDGIPLNPDGSAAVDLSALPLRALGEVRVWRGGGPAWLLAAPLGGVVDLRTAPEARAPLSVAVSGGSWSTGQLQFQGATTAGGVEVLGAASALTSQADFRFYDDNGTDGDRLDDALRRREGNDRHQAGGLLRLRAGDPGDRWVGLVGGTLRDEGLPGPVGGLPEGRLRTGWALGTLERRRTVGGTAWVARGWVQARAEGRTDAPGRPDRVEGLGHGGLHLGVRRALTTAQLGATARIRHDLRLRSPRQASDPAATRWSGTLALDAVWWPLGEVLRIEPVLHGRAWWDRQGEDGALRAAFSPRLSAAWMPRDGVVVHAAGGRAVRPPDFVERFGDRGVVQGRPDLRPERGTWADAGIRLGGRGLRAEAGVFHHDAVDRIVFVQNGQRTLVPINVGRSRATGVELAADGVVGPIDARLAGTFTDTAVRSDVPGLDGAALPRIPRWAGTADVGVSWRDRARLGLSLDAAAGNPWDEANLTRAAPRLLAGLLLRVHPAPGWPALIVEVRNLADTLALPMPRDPRYPEGPRVLRALTDFAAYPLPGRTALLTLRWTPAEAR